MNLLQLHYFVAVVEEGTISSAARRLHISQPPLSVQIQNLEKEYNMKLLDRGARHVKLTEAGKLLYNYACKIIEMEDSAENDMNSMRIGLRASVRMGMISSGNCRHFFTGLSKFQRVHPDITFRVYEGNTYSLLEELDKQHIETAIIRKPYQASDLEEILLQRDGFMAAGKKELMDTLHEGRLSLADLADKPLIIYRRWQVILEDQMEKAGMKPHIVCVNDDARTSIQWAAAGMGLALVPESAAAVIPDLPRRRITEKELDSDIYLIRRTDYRFSESARLFFDFFKEMAQQFSPEELLLHR